MYLFVSYICVYIHVIYVYVSSTSLSAQHTHNIAILLNLIQVNEQVKVSSYSLHLDFPDDKLVEYPFLCLFDNSISYLFVCVNF
jgi:hypothetical protein